MTLEDETGFVNLVLWRDVFERHFAMARTVTFLGATGRLQVEGTVVHLVAEHLWHPHQYIGAITIDRPSRDFH